MTDIDDLLRQKDKLKKELEDWQRKKAVAESKAEEAKKDLLAAMGDLKTEFGCSSFEEANKLRDKLQKSLENKIEELEGSLDALRRS